MPHTIKVSVNEWAVLDRDADAELMTDGLSGCVAIAARTHDHIGLTHVFSGAEDPKKFERYLPEIEGFIDRLGGKDAIEELHLVRNSSNVYQEQDNSLTRMIARHLIDNDLVDQGSIRIHRDNGCTITGENLYLCSLDNQHIYNRGFTNTELEYLSPTQTKTLSTQLTAGTYDQGLMKYAAMPSEVYRAPESGHDHRQDAKSTGEAFERRPSEPAPPQRGQVVDSNENDTPQPKANEKKRDRSALDDAPADTRPNSNPFGWPTLGQPPGFGSQQFGQSSPFDEDPPPVAKKSKLPEAPEHGANLHRTDPEHARVLGMIERLPEDHHFRRDPLSAADAIVCFARKNGLHEITDVQSTRHGNTAVMVEGMHESGLKTFAPEALRSSEIDRYAGKDLDAPKSIPPPALYQGEHITRQI
jgi:hypothetical protein